MECTIEDLANFVEEHDWIQHNYKDNVGGYCLVGAMMELCGSPDGWHSLYYKLEDKLETILPKMYSRPGGFSLTQWNDFPERTKEEVLNFLRS